jgi:hypothetical protein
LLLEAVEVSRAQYARVGVTERAEDGRDNRLRLGDSCAVAGRLQRLPQPLAEVRSDDSVGIKELLFDEQA